MEWVTLRDEYMPLLVIFQDYDAEGGEKMRVKVLYMLDGLWGW
jgi:hypothetical protein